MKRFTSLEEVTIPDLQEVLHRWQDGYMTFVDVQTWAEGIIQAEGNKEWTAYPDDDPRSAVGEIMTLLNWMYSTHVMRGDVPALLQFLDLFEEDPQRAWAYYHEASKAIDSFKRSDLPFE